MIKKILSLFVFLYFIQDVQAQIRILNSDTSVCPSTCVKFTAVSDGRVPIPIHFGDDVHTSVVPLGFTFNFYGTNYTQCVISSNGYISFDLGLAGTGSDWNTEGPIPNPGNTRQPNNAIFGYYIDIDPSAGGTLDYATVGTAPNRKFVVSFCDAPLYSCTANITSFQIILYEGTNIIETHIKNAPSCNSWPAAPNAGRATEGVVNGDHSDAVTVPGRNWEPYVVANSAHRFTPDPILNSYTVAPIQYDLVKNKNADIFWYSRTGALIGIGDTTTVCFNNFPTYIIARNVQCSDTTADTVYITEYFPYQTHNLQKTDPTVCGAPDGTISFEGYTNNTSATVYFKRDGVIQPGVAVISDPTGKITVNGLIAGTYDSIYAQTGPCRSAPLGPITLTDPVFKADFTSLNKLGCTEDTVHFTNTSNVVGTFYSHWNFDNGDTSNVASPVHIYKNQGIYNVKLAINNGYCFDTIIHSINTEHPLIASFTYDDDSVCYGVPIAFTNTSTVQLWLGGPPHYEWDFGDSTTTGDPSPIHTYAKAGVWTVRLIATDALQCKDTAYHTMVVDPSTFIDFTLEKPFFCQGEAATLYGIRQDTGQIGSTWDFGDGTFFYNRDTVSHSYDKPGTYNVTYTVHNRICPDRTLTLPVPVIAQPILNLGPDTSFCPSNIPVKLEDPNHSSNINATWKWSTGDTTNVLMVKHHGEYWGTVTVDGCSTTDSITVFKNCYLDIPNVFTPNGDNVNNHFMPRQQLSKGVKRFNMDIYNRWGTKIFNTTSIEGRGWDGKLNGENQPQGVYIYVIDVEFIDGNKENYKGNVTLLR